MNTSVPQESQFNISKVYSQDDIYNDLDPMLEGGSFKVAFYRQCIFQIREQDPQGNELGRRETLNVRIMSSPSQQPYQQIKVQITSQNNLFLVLESKLNEKKFDRIKKMQSLNFNFQSLLPMLIKMLNLCDKFTNQYNTVLYLNKSEPHQMKIFQNIQYKSIQLLSLQFQPIDPEIKKQTLGFRFSLLKSKNEKIQKKTTQMLSMVRLKSQSLLQVLMKKNNSTTMGVTMGTTMMMSRLNKSTYR